MNSIQFGSIYKVKVDNLPKDKKLVDYCPAVMEYLKNNTKIDDLYTSSKKIEMVSARSYENWAYTWRSDHLKTLWFVTDDENGKDYTQFMKARDKAMGMVDFVENLGDKLPALGPLTFAISFMTQQIGMSLMDKVARLRMTPKQIMMHHKPRVKELTFNPATIDPNKAWLQQVKLVKGKV